MQTVTIKKDIPLPEHIAIDLCKPRKGRGRKAKYPWENLTPGDAFQIDGSISTARVLAAQRNIRCKTERYSATFHYGAPHIVRLK
jgi:hypothetical protein